MDGGFSEIYYGLIFLILAVFQDEIKGFLSSVLCFAMISTSEYIINTTSSYGLSFFESAIIFEFILIVTGLFLIGSKAGLLLVIVSFISVIINIICWSIYTSYGEFIFNYYGLVNIILFEILLYGHFTTTKIYPVFKEKLIRFEKHIEDKIKNLSKGEVK
jgi:hypothetical protein